ncbi:MAG: hypothetical protein IJ614_09385 [Prevotella sp.]|nr:hypothetical protein [Prevotella sp.]
MTAGGMAVGESKAPFTILGSPGNGVVNTGASYGEYTAYINVPGKWSVATEKGLANIYPSSGEGPTTAIVQVGENWGTMRENVLTLTTQDAATRAAGDSDYKLSIVQSGSPELDSISTVFSANKGAGYSYMPGGEYCDGALIQLFNLVTLDSIQQATGVRLISDAIFPQTEQEYITADSQSGLVKGLTVNASIGMDFGKVKNKSGSGSIGVDVGKGHQEKSKNKYALKRLKTTQFTREIQYMNVMALLKQATTREEKRKLLSPGFLSVQETFAKDITAAKGNTAKQNDLCDKFVSEIGPCFISKSVMGVVLDYQISVDSTALRDTLGVQVALEASFQKNIKSSGGGSIDIGYSKEATNLMDKTTATVKVRGGDVSKVCILVTGGVLEDSEVTAWQTSCTPTRAVMVDMSLIPIYALITDDYARQVLADYFKLRIEN